jgi:hypothetical protein
MKILIMLLLSLFFLSCSNSFAPIPNIDNQHDIVGTWVSNSDILLFDMGGKGTQNGKQIQYVLFGNNLKINGVNYQIVMMGYDTILYLINGEKVFKYNKGR